MNIDPIDRLANFKKRSLEDILVAGQRGFASRLAARAFLCFTLATVPAFSVEDYSPKGPTARSLIGLHDEAQTNGNGAESRELEGLRRQLSDKTRELQEYKASLFRSSHPQDQAKIQELNQCILNQEKNQQEFVTNIQRLENEVAEARKQIKSLEISSDALTSFIQNQREAVEAERAELASRMQALEQNPELQNERENNKKLQAEVQSLRDALTSLEHQFKQKEVNFDKELQDALSDSASLKFSLADVREKLEQKEKELAVSLTNYLALSLEHFKQAEHQQSIANNEYQEAQHDIALFKSIIDEISSENLKLQRENELLALQQGNNNSSLGQQYSEKQSLLEKLQAKEAELSNALIHFENTIEGLNKQVFDLNEQVLTEKASGNKMLEEHDRLFEMHTNLKNGSESDIANADDTINGMLFGYQAALSGYLSELETLQAHLDKETALRTTLAQEKDELIRQLETEKNHYQKTLEEKEKALAEAMGISGSRSEEHDEKIESLTRALEREEDARRQIQLAHDTLVREHADIQRNLEVRTAHHEALERAFDEKERALAEANDTPHPLAAEHAARIELLKADLDKELEARNQLQQTNAALALEHADAHLELERHRADRQAYEEKERLLNEALEASSASVSEHLAKIASLQAALLQEEEARRQLQQEHDLLTINHSDTRLELERALDEKERNLSEAIEISSVLVNEQLDKIEDLKNTLMQEEEARKQLQQEYETLTSNHSDTRLELDRHVADRESLERALAEKEQALNEALATSSTSVSEQLAKIEALQAALMQEEEARRQLQQEHDTLTRNHTDTRLEFDRHIADRESLERALEEKDRALNEALASSSSAVGEHLTKIEALQAALVQEEEARRQLMQEQDALLRNHADTRFELDRHVADRESLERALEEKERALNEALASSSSAVGEHLTKIEALQAALMQEEEARHQLQQEHNALTRNHTDTRLELDRHVADRESLERALAEKEQALNEALSSSSSAISEHLTKIEALQTALMQEEEARRQLMQEQDTLTRNYSDTRFELDRHIADRESLERALAEKERALNEALASSSSAVGEHLTKIETLQAALMQEEEARRQLQQEHDTLTRNYTDTRLELDRHAADRESLERALAEKEQALNEALASSSSSVNEQLAKIEALQTALMQAENARHQLQQEHDTLTRNYSDTRLELDRAVEEKERALSEARASSNSLDSEYLAKIEALQTALMQEEGVHRQLQQEHDALIRNHTDTLMDLEHHLADKDSLNRNVSDSLAEIAHLQEQADELNQQHIRQVEQLRAEMQEQLVRFEIAEQKHHAEIQALVPREELDSTLSSLQNESAQAKNQAARLEIELAELQAENESISHKAASELNSLRKQAEEDHIAVSSLEEEIHRLQRVLAEKETKENELESTVASLTRIAEQQDHALAEANSTFTMIQEQGFHLQLENDELKQRLNDLQTVSERDVND